MKFYISLPISGHTGDDVEQRIDMAKVVIEKYVKHCIDRGTGDALRGETQAIVKQLRGFDAYSDIYDPVSLNDNMQLSDDATGNGYDNPESVVALSEDIKTIIGSVDVVVLCDGWQDSRGCVLEMMTALLFGKRIALLIDGGIVCPKGREVLESLMTGPNVVDKSARASRAMPFGLYHI